jgi:hypothetical protein
LTAERALGILKSCGLGEGYNESSLHQNHDSLQGEYFTYQEIVLRISIESKAMGRMQQPF